MDPADVAKVAREETSEWLKIDHPVVAVVRPKLFGGWEGNWVAYNVAHDVKLPHAQAGKVAFLMYPQAETAEGRRDSLDPFVDQVGRLVECTCSANQSRTRS